MKLNTAVQFYIEKSDYIKGAGHELTYTPIENVIVRAIEGTEELKTSCYYCAWKGGFGERLMAAQAMGVMQMATLKMRFNPKIYEAIKERNVLVVKSMDETAFVDGKPNTTCINLYETWGDIDNVNDENLFMEFKVKRYESK